MTSNRNHGAIGAMNIQAVYQACPSWLQNLLCSIEGSRIAGRRYGRGFQALLQRFEGLSEADGKALAAVRIDRLRGMLAAAHHTRFWAPKIRHLAGLGDDEIEPALAGLPILQKRDVKDDTPAFINRAERAVRPAHTSGTTGSGLVFPVTQEFEQAQWAVWWRYRQWHGIRRDMWCGYFGGRSIVPIGDAQPPFWRFNYAGRQLMFSAYHLSIDTVAAYVDALNRHRPPWLHGYPSQITLLATLMEQRGLALSYRPRLITTGAESLLEPQQRAMRRVFGCGVRQHYGMAEGVANISECPRGALHVDDDFSGVEFIPVPGQPHIYRVIGTNLFNAAMPLFRYDTGDTVKISGRRCACGRSGRVIDAIQGRLEDVVTLPNGARVGRLDHIFKDMVNVAEAQIFQPDRSSLRLRVVPGKHYSPRDERHLLAEARARLGKDIHLDIDYVEKIERGPSGKLKFVVSKAGPS